MTPEPSLWMRKVAEDPGHSGWYVERFRRLRLDGVDISGEARTVDAMLERGSLVLDAGCGGGRVAGYLHAVGHDVVGVDVDPVLVQAAEADYPGPRWVVADLADLDLAAHGVVGTGLAYWLQFDVVRAVGQQVASTVTYVIPVVAVALGVLVLHERLTWPELAGAAIVVGSAIAIGRPQRPAAPPQS